MRPLNEEEIKRVYSNLTFLVGKLLVPQNLDYLLTRCSFLSLEQKEYCINRYSSRNKALTFLDMVSRFSCHKFNLFIEKLDRQDLKDMAVVLLGHSGKSNLYCIL